MKESFNKFKKKILIEVLIKSIVIALSASLILFSSVYIYLLVSEIKINVLYLVLASLCVFALVFGLLFLLLRPNDKKVAKRLDNELNLNEKVQTMIEYENEEGNIINLQRKDTLNILSNTSIKKLTMKFSVFFFVLIFIATSLCISAFALGVSKDDTGDDDPVNEIIDPTYELDNWTVKAIKDLIEYVEKSDINSNLKIKYVSLLNELLTDLENATKESQMKEKVVGVINTIKRELDIVNTNNEIYTVLKDVEYSFISTLAVQINRLDLEQIKNALDGFKIAINGSKDAILEIDVYFGQILKNSNLDKTDEVYLALMDLSNDLNKCQTSSDIIEDVNSAVDNNSVIIIEKLSKQKVNSDVSNYVIKELSLIFGIESEDVNINTGNGSGNQDGNQDGYDDGENKEGDKDGGLGTGEVLFGSNDSFFDPESGKVVYGDVLAKYQNDILGKLDEGIISEELKEYFEFYYDILIGTLEDEE